MNVDENGHIYWVAPSGNRYVLPREYKEYNVISVLQQLLHDHLFVTYNKIKGELGLI